jgi:hypothetical protein
MPTLPVAEPATGPLGGSLPALRTQRYAVSISDLSIVGVSGTLR